MLSMPRTEKESERKAASALLWGSDRNRESCIVPDSVCWPYNTMRLSENLVTPVKYNLHQVSGLTEDKRIHESLFTAFNCTVVKLDTKSMCNVFIWQQQWEGFPHPALQGCVHPPSMLCCWYPEGGSQRLTALVHYLSLRFPVSMSFALALLCWGPRGCWGAVDCFHCAACCF